MFFQETEELISKRTADVRAVFERNTSAGQILNIGRKSSAQSNGRHNRFSLALNSPEGFARKPFKSVMA